MSLLLYHQEKKKSQELLLFFQVKPLIFKKNLGPGPGKIGKRGATGYGNN